MKKINSFTGTFLIVVFVALSGCSDNATVIQNKDLHQIDSMKLVSDPLAVSVRKILQSHYHFSQSSPYVLEVATKSGIVCNSNQNAPKKALSNFPSGFIRFDLYGKNREILYSYYKDLTHPASKEDIEEGFANLLQRLPKQ